jgi:hypothetical protein
MKHTMGTLNHRFLWLAMLGRRKNLSISDTIMVSVACAFMVCAALFLSACGGSEKPADTAVVKPIMPAVVLPASPASEASAPVSASAPATDPAPASEPVASASVAASAPPVVSPPTPKPVLIEIHGDDAMYGALPPFYAFNAQSEPANTQSILQAQFGGTVTVDNRAEGGTASTLLNMMNGVDGGGPPFAQRILSSKAEIVLDAHAINDDLAQSLGPYTDALIAFVQSVRAAGKIPVLEEPSPVCDDSRPHLDNYVSVMDGIAEQYNVPVVKQYDYLQTIPNLCAHYTAGIFPDNAIYAIKAQRQAAVLAPIVRTLMGE